jgi:hypothetical protein
MMKKLLVLALVLSMATIANAGLTFVTSTGVTEVTAGQQVTINLVTDAGTSIMGFGFDAVVGSGVASGGAIAQPAIFQSRTNGPMNYAPGVLAAYTYASNTDTPSVYTTGIVYSFNLVIPALPASTNIVINTMSDGDLYLDAAYFAAGVGEVDGNFNALTLHVTPEPMTLSLLGLGGLFLRRRK